MSEEPGTIRVPNQEPAAIFVWIPKTAGAALTTLVFDWYPRRYQFHVHTEEASGELQPSMEFRIEDVCARLEALPERERDSLQLVAGHVPFGLHACLRQPSRYVSVVRDPVERALSAYHYLRNYPPGWWAAPMEAATDAARNLSLEDFIRHNTSAGVINGQTAFLAGAAFTEPVDRTMLEHAKSNILERFATVGVTERLDESLVVMADALGWTGPLSLSRTNTNSLRPRQAEVDPETLAMIEDRNDLDRELYLFAWERLDAQIAALGAQFDDRLRTLRADDRRAQRQRQLEKMIPGVFLRAWRRLPEPARTSMHRILRDRGNHRPS